MRDVKVDVIFVRTTVREKFIVDYLKKDEILTQKEILDGWPEN